MAVALRRQRQQHHHQTNNHQAGVVAAAASDDTGLTFHHAMSRLINQSLARKLAIASANERSVRIYGVAKFTRCSQAFLDAVEAEVTNVIHRRAAELWQKGKTLT